MPLSRWSRSQPPGVLWAWIEDGVPCARGDGRHGVLAAVAAQGGDRRTQPDAAGAGGAALLCQHPAPELTWDLALLFINATAGRETYS